MQVGKLCILVVQWSQTAEDVTVILHAGRPLKQNDIEVVFSDDKVNVGLTGGASYLPYICSVCAYKSICI